jgi:hypothetical protein
MTTGLGKSTLLIGHQPFFQYRREIPFSVPTSVIPNLHPFGAIHLSPDFKKVRTHVFDVGLTPLTNSLAAFNER